MVQEPLTLYKLIILYMLDKVSFPLTNSQISNFVLDKEYTDYMTFQSACSYLIDNKLIESNKVRNRTLLSITEEGKTALNFFQSRISESIKEDIQNYLNENELNMRNEVSVLSDYHKTTNGEYEAVLWAMDKEEELIRIKLSVPTEDNAREICVNWQTKNNEIYKYLMENLL